MTVFTGIVEELGEMLAVQRLGDGADAAARVTVRGPRVTADTRAGDSVAVDGVCLTVAETEPDLASFTADVMGETLRRTTLGGLRPGAAVNLERAAALGSRLGGHLVQGHVDGVGRVLDRASTPHWDVLRVGVPGGLGRYLAEKGSVALDGVSLTVVEVADDPPSFTVGLIPETLARTTLERRHAGDLVNVEVDVVAKYVERLAGHLLGHQGDPRGGTAGKERP
jgi:riboflavin synthase